MRIPTTREIHPVVRSGSLAALLPVLLRIMPLPRLLSMLEPRKRERSQEISAHELAEIAGAVVRRGPRFGVGECLLRSLVLYNVLRRFAYRPVLLIGGRFSEGGLALHSWIEVDGMPLCEKNNPRQVFNILFMHEVNQKYA
jgi:hypothetical protein